MAKKSFSGRKSLRNLFSKSEANLEESVDKEDRRGTLRLFKWKKKQKTESSDTESLKAARTESGTPGAGDGESQDGEKSSKRKTSLFGSVFRSKKGLLSYSETDLRKPKGFAASLSWKKKKKKRDLSQGLSSNSDIPGVKEDISEQEEYDNQVEVEPNQLGFEATMPMAEPPCTSDLSQTQDVLSDMSRPNEEDAGSMPSDLGSTSIQFIDSSLSDSDAYQTPPDSPVPEYFSSDYTDTQAVDRSSQYSTSGSDITDSFSPVPNMETSANTDTCTVHNSSTDLNLNDHSEVSKSGILADVEIKTITTDVVKKDSYLGNKKSTDAVHHNYMSSINQSSTTSVSEIPTTSIPSIPQSSISFISENSPTSIPKISISSISENSPTSIAQSSIPTISENPPTSIPQSSISSISENYPTSIPQISISSISENSPTSIPQSSISSISENSPTSIPQSSISSISENSPTSIPQSSISSIFQRSPIPSDKTMTQSSSSDSNSAFTLEYFSTHPPSITSTEVEDSQTNTANNRNLSASNSDRVKTDPSSATAKSTKSISVSSMPEVILSSSVSYSRITENSYKDTDIKTILSFSNTDVYESDLSSVTPSLPTSTLHYTSDLRFLEETHPESNCETISMESNQTDNYSFSTFATDSEKPAEPVLFEDELNIDLPGASRIYTTIKSSKKVTFDLSGHSEPISPDHSQKGLSNNMFYPDVETLTETSAEDHVNQERDKIKSTNSSDFLDSGVSSTSEIRPAITIHPPPHLDVSYQLFSTRSPQGEIDKQQKPCEDCEVDVQEASTQSSELTGHDETTAEGITTRNDLQMSEKNKYGPELEEGSRPDPDYHYKSHVMPVQEPEPIEIITATESMTIRNDLHMFVKEKYDQDVAERRVIYDEHYYVSFDQEKDAEEEKIVDVLTQEQTLLHNISEKYEVEVQREELQMVQRTRGASALMEAEVCGVKVLTGQAEKQILCLDPLKPDPPVNQECGSEECTSAPPFSEPVKVSLADSSMETHSHLEIRPRPSAPHQPSGEITTLEDTARCIYQTSTDNPHAEREEHTSRNIDTSLKRTQESESQDHRPGKISAEETFTHAEDTRYTQGTVTSRDYISHRNWEEVSDRSSDEIREEDTAEVNTFPDQLLSRNLVPGERTFFHASVLRTVIEESDTESQAETEPGSDADMSSSVAVFKLSRPSSAREGRDEAMVVHKVSLVSDKQGRFGNHESPLDDFRRRDEAEPSKASPELERRWKSLYSEGQQTGFMENTHLSSSSQLAHSYERGIYSSHFPSQTQPTLPSGTDGGQGNTDWKVVESKVHESGRIREEFSSAEERERETRTTVFSSPVERESERETRTTVFSSPVERERETRTTVFDSPVERERERETRTTVFDSPVERERETRTTVFDSQAQFDSRLMIVETDDFSSDVFQATRVELIPSPTDLEPDALSPSSLTEMDNLVDTLKSMDRPIRQRLQRTPSNTPFSSLPPIEEDSPVPPPLLSPLSPVSDPKTSLNGVSSFPLDMGFSWSSPKDMRSPMTMVKEQQFGEAGRGLSLPLRASALSSIVMRRGSLNDLTSPEETPGKTLTNGSGSRLENSFFFQPTENGKASSRSIFRAASLPEIGPGVERMSSANKGSDTALVSRLERFSFLTSPSCSLSGLAETSRMSVAPGQQNSAETYNHKSTMELYRSLPSEALLKNSQPLSLPQSLSLSQPLSLPQSLSLPRSSSLDGGLLINDTRGFQSNPNPEPERNLPLKYRAFPDAYLTKEKEHGKLNPRPGKMLIYDGPGMSGQRIEVRGDVVDATPWEFTDTISVRVIRGGWVMYEKPDFKGEKIALDEGDIELRDPFGPAEEHESHQNDGTTMDRGEEDEEPRMKRRCVIGSIRRAVRDYSVPEICLFPEENAEGKKVTFRDTSDDARIFGFPIKANSIIINAGLWLVFAEPFFQGVPRVLEVGGFSNPTAWGVTHPYVASVHPLKIGEPRVENLHEPKIVLYEKPYFTGKSRELYSSMRDFLSRVDRQQQLFVFSPGSIKVIGGCWVGYEKEGFRGNQYLLEEGEYHDWRVWGGVDSELRSLRVIRADLSEPLLVLYGMPEEQKEEEEERTFEVTEAVPDVELFGFGINTHSIHVLSGAWVAYSHVDFSGSQYVLEKGFYNNCGDWGSGDNRICSLQPILAAPSEGPSFRNEVLLYSDLDFQGSCRVCSLNQSCLPESLSVRSVRVVGGSWVLYGGENFTGNMCVLSEGDYPSLTSMAFPPDSSVRSVKAVPMGFSVPSISLFGLECFEGREVTFDSPVSNIQEEGFNTHFLSVRVNSGCWVLCEHSNYRGRQFLLEPIEITNWHQFSSVSCVGSLYPVRQKQRLFRVRNKETGHYISVQGGVEDMKTGRVVVSEQVEGMSDLWLYQDGLIKNKLARSTSIQVMGNVEPGAKVVLWTETRVPVQTWSAEVRGQIKSNTFPGMVLDIKGGKTYDREHLVIREENEERESQQWELEFV